MSEISKVQLGENGTIYDIKDASAIRGIKINGENVAASNNIVDLTQYGGYYGVCSTAAATAIKDVSCTGFVLQTGSIITVRFAVTNTAAVADLKLNVNSTGAKNIKYRNGNLSSVGLLAENRTYLFVYDGTYWQIIGDMELVGSILYGTCTTGASTAAKVVTLAEFDTLITGVTIHVKMANSNTASNPTLNVNSTGAKYICRNGTTKVGNTEGTSWVAGAILSLTYDGTNWVMNDSCSFPLDHTHPDQDIKWGTVNLAGSYNFLDGLMNQFLSPNRFAGAKAAGITIEYSNDAGSTWTTYPDLSDNAKSNIFTNRSTWVRIGGPSSVTPTVSANSQLRITINTSAAGIYTVINKMHIWVSTSNSQNCKVTIKAATHGDPTNFSKIICEDQPILGWSGWNVIATGGFTTYGNSNSQYQYIQFTFTHTGTTEGHETAGLLVGSIMGFGGFGWTCPSQLAQSGHVYSFDGLMRTTFPNTMTISGGGLNVTGAATFNTGSTVKNGLSVYSGITVNSGVITVSGSQYEDSYSGALNMNNSNIYGLNSIYTSDASDDAAEGFHFYRDTTHVDTFRIASGKMYFYANRTLGQKPSPSGVVLHTGNTTVTQTLSSGTKIGTITIDGTSTDIYCQTNTDTKVTQTNSTSDGSYRVLLSGSTNDTTETTTSNKSGKLLFNPSSGVLSVDNSVTINYSGSQTRLVRYTSTGSYFVSPSSGGWAGGMSYRNSTDDTSLASIGVYGSGDTINYAYIGTTYNTPWFKITPTGESTFTNSATITNESGPLYFIASRSDTDFSLQFGVQSSGTYGGIYANTANTDRWILQYDETDLSLFTKLHTDTEETAMYAVPFFGDTPSSARKTLLNSNGFRYLSKYGSTTEEGTAQLVLGTGVATGSNANMTGSIRLYSSDTGYHIIKGETTSATQNITIPADSGTIMLLGTPGNSIPESADLNTSTYYDTSKHFYSQDSSISTTLVNTPWKQSGFQLFNIPTVSNSYLKQVVIPNDDAIPFLYRYKTPSNTSTWRGPGTGFYFVKGTQTSSTNVWTGKLDIPELYDGLTIAFYLPYSGTSSSATLNLTLSTGQSTGAIPVYYSGTTRATTHYTAGSTVVLTYWGAGSISVSGTDTTEARWTRSDYNANNYVTQNIRATTVTTKYPLLLSAYDTSSSSTSAASVYRTPAIYAQPSTGKITANGYSLTPVSGSEQPELFSGTVSSGNNITCNNTSHSWSNYNLILLKIGPASGTGSTTHFIYLPFKWLIENVDANTQFRSYELSQVNAQLYITNATNHGFTLGLSSGTWSSTTKVTCIAII